MSWCVLTFIAMMRLVLEGGQGDMKRKYLDREGGWSKYIYEEAKDIPH